MIYNKKKENGENKYTYHQPESAHLYNVSSFTERSQSIIHQEIGLLTVRKTLETKTPGYNLCSLNHKYKQCSFLSEDHLPFA